MSWHVSLTTVSQLALRYASIEAPAKGDSPTTLRGGPIINHSLYPRNGVVNDGRLSSETLWPRVKYLQAVKNLLRHISQLSLPPRFTPATKESRTPLHHKLFYLFISIANTTPSIAFHTVCSLLWRRRERGREPRSPMIEPRRCFSLIIAPPGSSRTYPFPCPSWHRFGDSDAVVPFYSSYPLSSK